MQEGLFIKMKKIIITIILTMHTILWAANFNIEKNEIYVNGFLNDTEILEFTKKVDDNSQVTTVVFENSLGGTAKAARDYAKYIKQKKLMTMVKGQCHSACAIAFLSGRKRSFYDHVGTSIILFHGVHQFEKNSTISSQGSTEVNAVLINLMMDLTEGKIAPIISKIKIHWKPASGIVFVTRNYYFKTIYKSFDCDGAQGSDISKCQSIEADPYVLGILTPIEDLKK